MKDLAILKQANVDITSALNFWGDQEGYNSGLEEYLNSLDEKLNNLTKYKDTKDYNDYGILSHSLKSEAKYLGFMQEAEVFYNHEMAGKESNEEYITNNFNTLATTITSIKTTLNKYFGRDNFNKTILIADDSDIIRQYISHNLNNYNIITATNGEECINNLQNNIYALFLDLNMPKVDGYKVLEYMHDNELLYKIPVIIITGNDSKEALQKAFDYPILDVLTKPFSNERISRALMAIKNFYDKQ